MSPSSCSKQRRIDSQHVDESRAPRRPASRSKQRCTELLGIAAM